MLKIKIQLSNIKDLIGLIQGFMNQAASKLAGKKRSLEELYKMRDFYR